MQDRFWNYVGKKTKAGCVLWNGYRTKDGYGQIGTGGKRGLVLVHRLAFQLMVGEIPEGLHVLHTCDEPRCILPTHLFLGTNEDNIKDKVKKGRQTRGENHYAAKITERGVRTIRRLYATRRVLQKHLAERFGISVPAVSVIVNRKSWKHVT